MNTEADQQIDCDAGYARNGGVAAPEISDNPTLEEAETYLRSIGIDPKDVTNQFIERLLRENLDLKQQRDDLAEVLEACHLLLNTIDSEHEEGFTTMEPLDERLKRLFFSGDAITDDDVNGDD